MRLSFTEKSILTLVGNFWYTNQTKSAIYFFFRDPAELTNLNQQLVTLQADIVTKNNTLELVVAEKAELESKGQYLAEQCRNMLQEKQVLTQVIILYRNKFLGWNWISTHPSIHNENILCLPFYITLMPCFIAFIVLRYFSENF